MAKSHGPKNHFRWTQRRVEQPIDRRQAFCEQNGTGHICIAQNENNGAEESALWNGRRVRDPADEGVIHGVPQHVQPLSKIEPLSLHALAEKGNVIRHPDVIHRRGTKHSRAVRRGLQERKRSFLIGVYPSKHPS